MWLIETPKFHFGRGGVGNENDCQASTSLVCLARRASTKLMVFFVDFNNLQLQCICFQILTLTMVMWSLPLVKFLFLHQTLETLCKVSVTIEGEQDGTKKFGWEKKNLVAWGYKYSVSHHIVCPRCSLGRISLSPLRTIPSDLVPGQMYGFSSFSADLLQVVLGHPFVFSLCGLF